MGTMMKTSKSKKYVCSLLFVISVLLTGCKLNINNNANTKLSRIEIQTPGGTNVATLDKQTQSDVMNFFDEEAWELYSNTAPDQTLIPKFIIELYQEKTHTVIKSESSDDYEKIMTYTVYDNSDIVMVHICSDTAKAPLVSEEYLTFYYVGSENFFTALENATR